MPPVEIMPDAQRDNDLDASIREIDRLRGEVENVQQRLQRGNVQDDSDNMVQIQIDQPRVTVYSDGDSGSDEELI